MRARDSGFSLMETIVALVVFTGVLIALERSTALGWRGIRLARSDAAALALARAKLATFPVVNDLTEDAQQAGVDDGFEWRVAVRKYVAPDAVPVSDRVIPYWVTVTVTWRDRPMGPPHSVELTTLKLEAAP